jgi:hypothetical protein
MKMKHLITTLVVLASPLANAAEVVSFDSASIPPSEFQQRRAKARGEVLEPQKGQLIQAFVLKPPGDGPHPVILYLPDCSGLAAVVKGDDFTTERLMLDPTKGGVPESSREVFWARRLLSWGYAVILVDNYTPRGMGHTCVDTARNVVRIPDAYGALTYAAKQSWADPQRIGLLGFLQMITGACRARATAAFSFSDPRRSRQRSPSSIFPGCGLRAPWQRRRSSSMAMPGRARQKPAPD